VLDCLAGYFAHLAALATGVTVPDALNFGPRLRTRTTAAQLASALLRAMEAPTDWTHEADPVSLEMPSLALDSGLARRTLGWSDQLTDKQMVDATASWYRAWARGEDMRDVSLRQIAQYEVLA
jgi:CDP-glucose 4,6-dehydratase